MFEYLMPNLWMKAYPRTIVEQSLHTVVEAQRLYARGNRIPWGISESAHAAVDSNGCYQYRAFGLPALALKREKTRARVIAPYASFLALGTHPSAAVSNLRSMWKRGWTGRYGFYEAIDFQTGGSGRCEALPVKSWMAHHQAMTLLAVANRLLRSPFQQYFHAEPQVIATELLLHEKLPTGLNVKPEPEIEPSLKAVPPDELRDRLPVQQVM